MLAAPTDRKTLERSLAVRLIEMGKLEEPALERALRLQGENAEHLEALLVKLGFTSERDIAEALAAHLSLPIATVSDYPDEPVMEGEINQAFLLRAAILPLAKTADGLLLAMVDPANDYARRAVEMASDMRVLPMIAMPSELEAAYARLYEPTAQPDDLAVAAGESGDSELLEDIDRLRDLASEGPVIRLVSQLISKAVESRASDIHIEPFQNRLAVRYRIDGVLRDTAQPPMQLRAAIISRIKIMAKLNIAEHRLPQDGRIRATVQGTDYDLRVSTTPTLHGESVVMRILDRSSLVQDLPALGFSDAALQPFLDVLDRPHGILLVTGPTGSGKTTTLYTALMRLNSAERKIFTVEDPVEYQIDGINQIQVKPKIGLTFSHILRAILRQDPDIVMIGEMRDIETAQLAIQAALTGHLVLSTLHTNSAAASVTRLLEMGVSDYLVTSTLNGVLAQRLVRRLCEHCREPYEAMPELIASLGLAATDAPITLYRAGGCDACHGQGYRGRIAVTELLVMSESLRRLVLTNAEASAIHRMAQQEGMRSMYADGLDKVLVGLTTVDEVLRVTRDI